MLCTSGNKAHFTKFKQQLLILSHSDVPTAMGSSEYRTSGWSHLGHVSLRLDWSNHAVPGITRVKWRKKKWSREMI